MPAKLRRPVLAAIVLTLAVVPGAEARSAASPETAAKIRDTKRVSLDLEGAALQDLLRYFAVTSGFNLILDPAVRGDVTLRLIDVPWNEAFEVVLRTNGLGYELDGNVLFVAPLAMLTARAQEEAAFAEARELAAPLRTVILRLSYATAADVAALVEATALTSRGMVSVDARTNSLIITDVERALSRARAVAAGR